MRTNASPIQTVYKKNAKQRPVFYPYADVSNNHEIVLSIKAESTDLRYPEKWELIIGCRPARNDRQKKAWIEIFNIESRYKARISKDNYKWKDRIITRYHNQVVNEKRDFNLFKNDILSDFSEYNDFECGILLKCFNEFLANDVNFEKNLKGEI